MLLYFILRCWFIAELIFRILSNTYYLMSLLLKVLEVEEVEEVMEVLEVLRSVLSCGD